jgi:hypothetical protein
MGEIWVAAIGAGAAVAGGAMQADAAKDAARAQGRAADAATAEQRRQFDLTREDTAPYREIGRQALGALGSIYGYSMPVTGYGGASGGTPGVDQRSGWRINPNGSVTGASMGSQGITAGGGMPGTDGMQTPSGVGMPDYSNFFASPDYQFRRDQGTQGIERSLAARGLGTSGNALAALTEYNSNLAAGEFGNYFNRQAALAGIGQTAVNTSANAGANAAGNIGNALMAGGNARASGIAGSANAWGNALGTAGGYLADWYNNRGGYGGGYGGGGGGGVYTGYINSGGIVG